MPLVRELIVADVSLDAVCENVLQLFPLLPLY